MTRVIEHLQIIDEPFQMLEKAIISLNLNIRSQMPSERVIHLVRIDEEEGFVRGHDGVCEEYYQAE